LFRIDRKLVNITGLELSKFDVQETPQAETESILPDAASVAELMVQERLQEAEAEARQKAEEILDVARKQAAQIILDARDDAAEELKRGFRQGFEDGSAEGRLSFDKKLAQKVREDDEILKRVLDEIYDERERMQAENEHTITNLSLEIVRKIINPAEEALGDVFTSLIKNALRQMQTDGKIIIRVGPVEYERFFSSGAAELELDSGITVRASVIRDVSLNEGDCIIDTDDVTVNAGIDSQLQFVKLAFERANQYEPD